MHEAVMCERFDADYDGFWIEGGEDVAIEPGGGLGVRADPPEPGAGDVCTIWCRTPITGDVSVSFDARVIHSHIHANNINFFLHYSDPDGDDLFATRHRRADAAYVKYHGLSGYIFTFLNDRHGEAPAGPDGKTVARLRIRRCPGFELLAERYGYRCREGETYHLAIERSGGMLKIAVDDTFAAEAPDTEPLSGGYFGFRTFRTHVVWSNLLITRK